MIELFLVGCGIGVAVAADVSIVTIAKFRDQTVTITNWVLPVTVLHVAFIAFGLYGTLDWTESYPAVSSLILIGSGVIVLWLCLEWLCEWTNHPLPLGPIALAEVAFARTPIARIAPNLALMLAVSLDALISAPSFSSEARDWPAYGVELVIALVGAVVCSLMLLAIWIAGNLAQQQRNGVGQFLRLAMAAKFFQVSVIGYFGIRSISEGLEITHSFLFSLTISLISTTCYFVLNWKQLRAVALQDYPSPDMERES